MVAVRVFDSANYIALYPEGTRGGIDMESKVDSWKLEIEDKLVDLAPTFMV